MTLKAIDFIMTHVWALCAAADQDWIEIGKLGEGKWLQMSNMEEMISNSLQLVLPKD